MAKIKVFGCNGPRIRQLLVELGRWGIEYEYRFTSSREPTLQIGNELVSDPIDIQLFLNLKKSQYTKHKKGKNDALEGKRASELTKAYVEGYREGMDIKEKIIEQEWND